MMLYIEWFRPDDEWFQLKTLESEILNALEDFLGVYVISHAKKGQRAIYAGSGDLGDRLSRHKSDAKIMQYAEFRFGPLYVTWALVDESNRFGIERFLFDEYNPVVAVNKPDVKPIEVNLPFEK